MRGFKESVGSGPGWHPGCVLSESQAHEGPSGTKGCTDNRWLTRAGLDGTEANATAGTRGARLERMVALVPMNDQEFKIQDKQMDPLPINGANLKCGPGEITAGDAEHYNAELRHDRDSTIQSLVDESRRLIHERWFFLATGVIFFGLGLVLTCTSLLFLVALCSYVAGRFLALARDNNVDLQVLRGQRLEVELAFVRVRTAVHLRKRNEIYAAVAKLTALDSNPILSSKQTTPEIERRKLIEETPALWHSMFRGPSRDQKGSHKTN